MQSTRRWLLFLTLPHTKGQLGLSYMNPINMFRIRTWVYQSDILTFQSTLLQVDQSTQNECFIKKLSKILRNLVFRKIMSRF